jgi:DNA-binding transcriptional ArsR family regulator
VGAEPDIAIVAAALADRSRATMCLAMMDGCARPAGDLAERAAIAPSTASEHLARLVEAGLVTATRSGRNRYFTLAGPAVADLLEDMAGLAPPGAIRSLGEERSRAALEMGRTCYDHLAGRLGVGLTDALIRRGVLDADDVHLTDRAEWFLRRRGIDIRGTGRRTPSRPCLDWTERRPHLGGAAGAAIATWLFEEGWIVRIGSGRAVRPTPQGLVSMRQTFGLDSDAHRLEAPPPARPRQAGILVEL